MRAMAREYVDQFMKIQENSSKRSNQDRKLENDGPHKQKCSANGSAARQPFA